MDLKYYKIIVESAPNLIWKSGTDAKCDYFNNTWVEFTGKTLEEEIGDGWVEGVHVDDLKHCVKTYLDSFEQRRPFEMEYRLRRHDGEYRWLNDRGVPFYEGGIFAGYIGSCIDVTEKIEGREFKVKAQRDGLTGVYNKNHFEKLMTHEFERVKRAKDVLSVIMLDIDDFKGINDTHGHLAGDNLLIALGKILERNIRDVDFCGRYGGDEFIIALPGISAQRALSVAERVRKKIEKVSLKVKGEKVQFSASFGISQSTNEESWRELVDKADKAMYQSKHKGKNRITLQEKE